MQDPVIHHNYSPYSAFDNNPVFWSDPSGADSWSTTMAEWVSAVEAEWAAVDSGADALKVLGSFSKDKGKGGGKVKKTKTVDGFALINYTAGKNYNYIAVISNFGNDGAAMLDYYAAYAAGIPIMLVDDVDGFDKGIDKLDLDGTIVNNYVINSHGGPGSFDIGSTDINMNSITNEEGSILKSVAKKLENKNLIILACNVGQAKNKGMDFTQEVAKQLQANVITSQHLIMSGYTYNGSSLWLTSFDSVDSGTYNHFTISHKGSDPTTIYNLGMDKNTNGLISKPQSFFSLT